MNRNIPGIVWTPLTPLQGVFYEKTGRRFKKPGFLGAIWAAAAAFGAVHSAPLAATFLCGMGAWELIFGGRDDKVFDETDRLIAEAKRLLPGSAQEDLVEVPPEEEAGYLEFLHQRGYEQPTIGIVEVPAREEEPQTYAYHPGPVTQLGLRQTVPMHQAPHQPRTTVATATKTVLSEILSYPMANRAFIGSQRTGKSGLIAVAGRQLATQGITFYHINLASYSGGAVDEDGLYTNHIHPANSVRGDIAQMEDREEVQQLVDRATSLVQDWFRTRESILVVDEWFSLASQTIGHSDIVTPLTRLIADKLAHLSSAGTKRGLAIWMATPLIKADSMSSIGKEIKQAKLCYIAIAPGKHIDFLGNKVKWDAGLFNYTKRNFEEIYEPKREVIRGHTRIGFLNGQWLPLGTTEEHFEDMKRPLLPAAVPLEKEEALPTNRAPKEAEHTPKSVVKFAELVTEYFVSKDLKGMQALGTLSHDCWKLRKAKDKYGLKKLKKLAEGAAKHDLLTITVEEGNIKIGLPQEDVCIEDVVFDDD